MKSISVFILVYFLIFCSHSDAADSDKNIFVIGQDIESIRDYLSSLKQYSKIDTSLPDGFMVYAALNDLRGLWEPVDQGAGINYANKLIQEYPQLKVVQAGLYLRYMLKEIVSGGLDRNIYQLGNWIKSTHKDVYLRIGYEFDNPENEYDPKEYIAAYRYTVDKLRGMGLKNVHFVWHTMAWRDKDGLPYDPLKWYPGDQYVDWVGISFFDGKQEAERNEAAKIAQRLRKPLMIAESSPFKQYSSEQKSEWMQRLFAFIQSRHVKFLSYIDMDWQSLPMFKAMNWGDARLQMHPILMKEWLKAIKSFQES